MTAYELMTKTNHHLIKGGDLTDSQRSNIVSQLLAARSSSERARRYARAMKCRTTYPSVFVPPYSADKYETVIPMYPKTHILSANSYELEIVRLLYLFAPDSTEVQNIVDQVIVRLRQACYSAHSCAVGECFETGIVVQRFLATVASDDTKWLRQQIDIYNKHHADKRRHSGVQRYYWLCLSEMPYEIAEEEIHRQSKAMNKQLDANSLKMGEVGEALPWVNAAKLALGRLRV